MYANLLDYSNSYSQLEKEGLSCIFAWCNDISFVPVWTSLQLVTGHKLLVTGIIEWAQAYFSSGIGRAHHAMVHITIIYMNTPWNSYVQMITVMQMLLVEFHWERSQHRQKAHLNLEHLADSTVTAKYGPERILYTLSIVLHYFASYSMAGQLRSTQTCQTISPEALNFWLMKAAYCGAAE